MDKELGVGNSMILHLVSLYWYSTVIIHIPPCNHPYIRASVHNYLTLKFSLSCLLHLRLCVRAGGNLLFINFSQSWVIKRMKIMV